MRASVSAPPTTWHPRCALRGLRSLRATSTASASSCITCLVGQPPYAGKNIQGILKAHIQAKPLRPERLREGGLSKEVGEVVRHATKRDPLFRPSAEELIEALDTIGGKELKQKESLKKRRTRNRARAAVKRREQAGKKAPALVAIAVVLGIGIIAAIAASGGSDTPARAASGGHELRAPDPTGPDPADVQVAPEETEEQRKARIALMVKTRLESEAKEALKRATAYARDTWHSKADTKVVRDQYLRVARKYKGTHAANQAKLIAQEIKERKRHPHPDREWSSQDAIQEARERWASDKVTVKAHIAKHAYAQARNLVPEQVSDESGRLALELEFWRDFTVDLQALQREIVKRVPRLEGGDRTLVTPKGEGTIKKISDARIEVDIDGRVAFFDWAEIAPKQLALLARNALESEDDARYLLYQLAFAFAHGLTDMFWDIELELSATPGASAHSRQQKAYGQRFKAWLSAK